MNQRASAPHAAAADPVAVRATAHPAKIWLPVAILFALLDLCFPLYFWRIPKVSSSESDWGYQFAIDQQQLSRPKAPGARRVLAFGSSISGSFDAHQVETLLGANGASEVYRLMLPGIHMSEYRALFASSDTVAPDVTVIMVNLVDFLYPSGERELNPTLRFVLPPRQSLRVRSDLSVADMLDLGLSSVSNLYRYRKLIRSAVQDNARAALRVLHSRSKPASYGVYPDGYTARRFALPISPDKTELAYFVDPEWLRQRGRVALTFRLAGKVIETRVEQAPGWKSLSIPRIDGRSSLEVEADSVWVPRAGAASDDPRMLGLRLKDAAPTSGTRDSHEPARYRLSDPGDLSPLLRMGGKRGEEFDRAWDEILNANTRFGKRFRLYRDAKIALRDKPFVVTDDYQAVRDLVASFRARGSKVLIINTPESPRILPQYETGPYYTGYREFFRSLADGKQVEFHDLSTTMPAEDFNDWHHLNYIGTIKLGTVYADLIRRVLP